MSASLVGSEMCIRDSLICLPLDVPGCLVEGGSPLGQGLEPGDSRHEGHGDLRTGSPSRVSEAPSALHGAFRPRAEG
eukprot:7295843-Alexandrium_andersonii.AAC.1